MAGVTLTLFANLSTSRRISVRELIGKDEQEEIRIRLFLSFDQRWRDFAFKPLAEPGFPECQVLLSHRGFDPLEPNPRGGLRLGHRGEEIVYRFEERPFAFQQADGAFGDQVGSSLGNIS